MNATISAAPKANCSGNSTRSVGTFKNRSKPFGSSSRSAPATLLSAFSSVSEKEVETARQFIARVGFDDFPDFIKYALSEARKTNFDVQTLSGLKQYLEGYLRHRADDAATRATKTARLAREREEAEQDAYQRFRRVEAQQLFSRLSTVEQNALKTDSKPTGLGPLSTRFAEINLLQLITRRYEDRLTTFAAWQASRPNKVGPLTQDTGTFDPNTRDL